MREERVREERVREERVREEDGRQKKLSDVNWWDDSPMDHTVVMEIADSVHDL